MKVTIFIPCYNSEESIGKVLDNCLKQEHEDYEVLVIDDGSSDNSGDIIKEMTKEYSDRLRVILNKENKGLAVNFNRAFEEANGEIVIINHADSLPRDKQLVKNMVSAFKDPDIAAVSVPWVVTGLNLGIVEDIYARICRLNYEIKEVENMSVHEVLDVDSRCVAFRKDVVKKLGGFRPIHKFCSEGPDLSLRMKKAGYRFIMTPKSYVFHLFDAHHQGLWHNMRWSLLYSSEAVVMHFIHPDDFPIRNEFFYTAYFLLACAVLLMPSTPLFDYFMLGLFSILTISIFYWSKSAIKMPLISGALGAAIFSGLAIYGKPNLQGSFLHTGIFYFSIGILGTQLLRLSKHALNYYRKCRSLLRVFISPPLILFDDVVKFSGTLWGFVKVLSSPFRQSNRS